MPAVQFAAKAACRSLEAAAAAAAAGRPKGLLLAFHGNQGPLQLLSASLCGAVKASGAPQGPPSHFLPPNLPSQLPLFSDSSSSSSKWIFNSSNSSSSMSSCSKWVALNQGSWSQASAPSLSLWTPGAPALWGPLPVFPPMPLEDPIARPQLRLPSDLSLGASPLGPHASPLEAPPAGPPPRSCPTPAEPAAGGPQSTEEGGPPKGYLCNKVRNDKRHRKRAFVQRGFWGRQRRLQLKHQRLRLAFAYQGVDLLKLKSLKWGEVWKGPWGSAMGG